MPQFASVQYMIGLRIVRISVSSPFSPSRTAPPERQRHVITATKPRRHVPVPHCLDHNACFQLPKTVKRIRKSVSNCMKSL